MMPVSLLQMPPVASPVFGGDTTPGRIHYLPGPVPSIEQILQRQTYSYVATGDAAENLLAALKQDNRNLEAMLAALEGCPI